jgi:protein involved in polysaccharide export with SLBB domain
MKSIRSVRIHATRLLVSALAAAALLLAPAAAQEAPVVDGSVGLYPGDIVRVQIWREPELSGEFQVDGHGIVTLPMIGEQRVTGLTLDEVRAQLTERFRVNIRNPTITVTPLRRVQVLGEVNRPGLYTLDPTVTLGGAIAMAMGANAQGDLRRIQIVRDGQTLLARVEADATLSDVDIRSGDQIFVGQKSWFVRHTPTLISTIVALPAAIATVVALLLR